MAAAGTESMAFSLSGGAVSVPSQARPVDLVHLARQTLGDRALEEEILALFLHQALAARDRILGANAEERMHLAHALVGSARGIGAFAVADCAARIQSDPLDEGLLAHLSDLIGQVRDFISALSR